VTNLDEEICEGESYRVGTSTYTMSGSYTDVLVAASGCDSVVNLDLIVIEPSLAEIDVIICEGDTYQIGSTVYNETGTYEKTIENAKGCDSIVTLNLTVIEPKITNVDAEICEGNSYAIAGETFDEEGSYIIILSDQYGCDSILNINLVVWPNYSEAVFASICDGEIFTIAGQDFSRSGIYSINLMSVHGCDSTINLNLDVTEALYETLDLSICTGDSVLMGGEYYSQSGSYTDTLIATGGCDSIITLNLLVVDELVTDLNIEICEGGSYTVGSTTYTETGVYSELFTSRAGCDSLVNLTLTVFPVKDTSIQTSICKGELFVVAGQVLNETGSYDFSLTTSEGCDSLIHVDLVVFEPFDTTHVINICEGESVTIGAETYLTSGVYTQNHLTLDGCDSIVVVDLTVSPVYQIDLVRNICEGGSVTVGPNTYSETGFYADTLTSIDGCDSIINLDLQVLESLIDTLDVQICEGSSYSLGSNTYTESGTYTENFLSQGGCDSMVILNLNVLTTLTDTLRVDLCDGESFDFDGDVTSNAGTYQKSYVSQSGCDSIVTLILTVLPVYNETISAEICEGESYLFGGTNYNEPGTYAHTFTAFSGCDSTISLNLAVTPVKRRTVNQQICFGQFYTFGEQTLGQSGTYLDTLLSVNGCDSIVTLNLSIKDVLRDTIDAEICLGQTYNFDGTQLDQPGTYEATFATQAGCDSIVTLLLAVSEILRDTINAQICLGQTYDFNGMILYSSGTYEYSSTTNAGCDSLVTLLLVVTDILRDTIEATICEASSIDFNGSLLTEEGTYEYATITAAGCDSIVTMLLSTSPNKSSSMAVEICEGQTYDFFGVVLNEAGTYQHSLSTHDGCDSVITLDLSINTSINTNISAEICPGQSFDFSGVSITEAGTYFDTLSSSFGCDSIVTLEVTVSDVLRDTIYENICEGQSFNFNGTALDRAGEYQDTSLSNDGCQTVITLFLEITDVLTDSISATICEGESYSLGSSSYNSTGSYSETFTSSSGCDSIVHLNLTLLPSISTQQTVEICAGEEYQFDGVSYSESSSLSATYTSASGCDSTVTIDLLVIEQKETNLSYSICDGESIEINGNTYTTETSFTEQYLSAGGCDSIVTYEILLLNNLDPRVSDHQICEGESVQLSIEGTGNAAVVWSPAAGLSCVDCVDPVASPSETTIYTVTVEGCGGAQIVRTLTVEVFPNPDIVVSADMLIQLGEAVTLSATTSNPSHLISWTNENSGTVICTGCPTIVQQPQETTVYQATASNELGCSVDAPVLVTIEDLCEVGEIEAANAFTPNGDGFNDNFEIRNTGDAEIILIQVYNRWGEIMFESETIDVLWDGTHLGEPLNPGVYMYQIQAVCAEVESVILTGNVTLIR
jgi:gliding motility-associated-like protein